MEKEDLWKIYDSTYANDYNERYLLNPFSKVSSTIELNILKELIDNDSKWLDLGCGTGYFLSQFPKIQRAGLDMSPEMLSFAAKSNPDALFFEQGDFRDEHEKWNNEWSLITCMWGAYCYVDSIREVEKVVENIINWTKQGGSVFFPIVDLEDVRPNTKIPYEEFTDVFGGKIALTSVTWSWKEQESGKEHIHLVSPHAEHFIKLLQPYFETIEIIRYPPYMQGWVSRKAILAKTKRGANENKETANVIWHEIPPPAVQSPMDVGNFTSPLAPISNKNLILEVLYRVKSGIFYRALLRKLFQKKN